MKRIFVEDVTLEEILITDDEAKHLSRSLRAARGDKITAVDSHGRCALVELTDFTNDTIKARRVSDIKRAAIDKKIILADCLPKRNRFESIIEKATELGIYKIQPLISERTIVRPNEIRGNSKLERWNRIAKEAAEQCARDSIPVIENICNLDDWLKKISPLDDSTLLLFCWENEKLTTIRKILSDYKNSLDDIKIIVLIGPEGGFSEREVQMILATGGISVTLGKTILKTDTAAISVLAMINYEFM